MAKKKATSYDESSIEVLQGLDGVRKKVGMYLGARGNPMIYRMVKELVDNAVDEFFAKRNTTVELFARPSKNEYIVADMAQGIPVGMHKTAKMSTLTAIFTILHAGGKFNDKAYKVSSGTHGLGSSAVNAVSELFEVWTQRDGVWYHQAYKEGKPITDVLKKNPPPKEVTKRLKTSKLSKYGTIIRIYPDQSIVSEDATNTKKKSKDYTQAVLDYHEAKEWLELIADLNPGLKVLFAYERVKGDKKKIFEHEFHNKNGLASIVKDMLKEHDWEAIGKAPLTVETDNISLCLQWCSYEETDHFKTYVNTSPTREHGSHFDGFFNALSKAISKYKEKGKKKDTFKPRDVLHGMIGVFNFKMSQAEYSSQTKDKLTSKVDKEIEENLLPHFEDYFHKNQKVVKMIIKRAAAISKGREELKAVMKSVSEVKKSSRGSLPACLLASPRSKPDQRELFVLEGDSAGGCFVADTPVLMADGSTLSFVELAERTKQGEIFQGKAFDIEKQKFVTVQFDEPRLTKYTQELVEVELSDGSKFTCTLDHPWLLANSTYVSAETLKEGDVLVVLSSSSDITVRSVRRISLDHPIPVYDATVPEYHNFCLGNGVVVHNTAQKARDSRYQEVFKLGGKIANAAKMPLAKLLASEAVQELLVALGIDTSTLNVEAENPTFSTAKLRIKSLLILTDADPDGKHISVLLLTLLHRLIPNMFTENRVYYVDAPLYSAFHNNKRYFGDTFEAVYSQLPAGVPKHIVVRAKGWGEVDPEMLHQVAFNPEKRKLFCINPPKGADEEWFKAIVGSDSSARKELLGL